MSLAMSLLGSLLRFKYDCANKAQVMPCAIVFRTQKERDAFAQIIADQLDLAYFGTKNGKVSAADIELRYEREE